MPERARSTPTVYVSVDIEADGPIPGPYSMVSFGAAVAGWHDSSGFRRAEGPSGFYRELRPISDRHDPEALAVSGLDRAALLREGAEPAEAMREFGDWLESVRLGPDGRRYRPVMVGYPAPYDWLFLYWYLVNFTGSSRTMPPRSGFTDAGAAGMATCARDRIGAAQSSSHRRRVAPPTA